MSRFEEATRCDEITDDKSGSANFVFINIEENIKKENVEEEQKNEDEEYVERVYGHKTPQEDSLKTETEIEDGEQYPPSASEEDCPPDGVSDADLNSRNNNQAFCCDKCSISFVSPVYLEGHRNRCRATRTDENTQAEKTADAQTLDADDADTPTRRTVKSRVPIGETKHKCGTCGRGFVRLSYLKAHEATHATVFKCDECPYTTDFRRNLKRHVVVHYGEGEKIYACPHCSYTAGKSSYLRKHVAKHAEAKPYRCHVCAYETAVITSLTKHMVTHNGEKAFACPHCYYSAARKAQLAKHVAKFHSMQTETGT